MMWYLVKRYFFLYNYAVAPLVGAWIEIFDLEYSIKHFASLPLWERGLKFFLLSIFRKSHNVAPLVGAWIEIGIDLEREAGEYSRSPCGSVDWNTSSSYNPCGSSGRSPCGSVDWNNLVRKYLTGQWRRSPCGSVDWNKTDMNRFSRLLSRSPCGSVDWN